MKGNAQERVTEERLSRRDYIDDVSPVSEVITKGTNVAGRLTSTTQTYSVDIPGSTRDQTLRPLQSSTTVQTPEAGRVVTEREVVQPDTIEKGLNTVVTMDIL